MTDTAIAISQADIEALEQLYTFRGRSKILEFMTQHPFLLPVLLEAAKEIRHYFADSQLFMEVIPDTEIPDWVHLVLSILTKLDPNDAVDRLNQLEWNWGLHNSYEVRSKFFTTLEYPDEF